jgi:ACS family hexuronate transporter-like MFS transporter
VNARRLRRYRWWIGCLLFASTVINYIDRQTLNVLAPSLKAEYRWSNQDFALIVISFRIAYAAMQVVSGRIIDRLGTRTGLTLAVSWYSTVAMLTATANGLASLCTLRFLLGAGEAANWPGATKAVAEWFPRRERGLAVALFDSGSSVGAAIAPAIVLWLRAHFGSWRPAFVITGALGFIWLALWRASYYPPDEHPRISQEEREMLTRDRVAEAAPAQATASRTSLGRLIALPQTWGCIAARSLTDPVWFMVTDWFAVFLVTRGFTLEDTLTGFWVPFIAADLGNFFGGGVSSALIARGWPVGRARKMLLAAGSVGVLALAPAAFLRSFPALVTCFAVATFCYAVASTMALALPADLYRSVDVASVSGMSGTGAGLGTIVSTFMIGVIADRFSFGPILVSASAVPLVAAALVLLLVRSPRGQQAAVVNAI